MQKFKIMRGTGFRDPRMSYFVRATGHFYTCPPDREKACFHDFCEIFWCITGNAVFHLDGNRYILQPEEVWYYPAGSFHEYFPGRKGFHYCWLTIDGPQAALLIEGTGIRPGINSAGECPVHLFALIEKLLPVSDKKTQMECLAAAFEILTRIYPDRNKKNDFNSAAFHAKCLIDARYTHPDFNVATVAERLNVHRSTISRQFLSSYSMTVHGYITLCRIKYAETLLRDTDTPISEIALMAGFNSAAYFSKVFSEHIGTTPGNYRRLNKSAGTPPSVLKQSISN